MKVTKGCQHVLRERAGVANICASSVLGALWAGEPSVGLNMRMNEMYLYNIWLRYALGQYKRGFPGLHRSNNTCKGDEKSWRHLPGLPEVDLVTMRAETWENLWP